MMEKGGFLTKFLAVTGAVLVWFPILVPVALSIIAIITERRFLFDFLMPAELFPLAFAGGALLAWAAWRMQSRFRFFAWGLGTAVGALAASQGLAVLTGLASGETEPAGWPLALVSASLIIYTLAVIAIGVGGVHMLRDLLKKP
jgi:hypothetical protein